MSLTIGSLFTGYAGLDMATEHVLGAHTVWHSENNPAASRLLAYRLPGVPNHGDITTIDWTTVEPVDILTAGWPCQPFSLAGKRKGTADERALWPHVADAIRLVRPRLVFLENVSAVVTAGELARATASLAALGYVGSWTCLRASDVGAPHRRERCFIVASDTEHHGRHGTTVRRSPDASPAARWLREPQGSSAGPDAAGAVAADTNGTGVKACGGRQGDAGRLQPVVSGGTDWGAYEPAIRRWEHILGRVAPPPTEPGRNGLPRLSPRFVEFMMGLPAGWVTDVPGTRRNDQLRILGNGVVPQQAIYALHTH